MEKEMATRQVLVASDDRQTRGDDQRIRKGDIVVTAVANSFAIGRVLNSDDLLQTVLCMEKNCDAAIVVACAMADEMERVFVYWNAHSNQHRMIPVDKKETLTPSKAKVIDPADALFIVPDNPAA